MKRILLDIMVAAAFLAVMSFHFLPKVLHEALGVLLPLAAAFHLFLNRRWFSALRSGTWDAMRCMGATVDLLLILCLILVTATGVCLSNHLFKDLMPLALQRNITLHQLHVSLPFAMLILLGIHLGLHWQGWKQRLINFFHWQEDSIAYRLGSIVTTFALVGMGIYGSLQNRVGDRLLMKHIFATPATDLPGAAYALLLLSIFALYACLGNGIRAAGHRFRNRNRRHNAA